MVRPTGVPRIAAATPKRSLVGRGAQWVWMSMMGNVVSGYCCHCEERSDEAISLDESFAARDCFGALARASQ
jgi:hypothetical protein